MKTKLNPAVALNALLHAPRSVTTGELADHLIAEMGGIKEFARSYVAEVNANKSGGVAKARLLDGVLRLVTNASAQKKGQLEDDGAGLTDEELHAEAARVLGTAHAA